MNDTVPPSRAAILLVQLGTPDKPEVPEVRRYLREFLTDRRVVEQSPLIWWPILYSVVLTRRPKESAEKYRSIWTKAGSPLLVNTKLVAEALQDELNKRGRQVEVVWAMRYGNRRWSTPCATCATGVSHASSCCRCTRSTRPPPAAPCST